MSYALYFKPHFLWSPQMGILEKLAEASEGREFLPESSPPSLRSPLERGRSNFVSLPFQLQTHGLLTLSLPGTDVALLCPESLAWQPSRWGPQYMARQKCGLNPMCGWGPVLTASPCEVSQPLFLVIFGCGSGSREWYSLYPLFCIRGVCRTSQDYLLFVKLSKPDKRAERISK